MIIIKYLNGNTGKTGIKKFSNQEKFTSWQQKAGREIEVLAVLR
jgi:hypothetical protein